MALYKFTLPPYLHPYSICKYLTCNQKNWRRQNFEQGGGGVHVHEIRNKSQKFILNPLMHTLKPQSNGALYSNTVTDTLMNGLLHLCSEEGTERAAAPPSLLLAVPNVTPHPSTANVPTSHYSIWHYNYLCTLKG